MDPKQKKWTLMDLKWNENGSTKTHKRMNQTGPKKRNKPCQNGLEAEFEWNPELEFYNNFLR